MSPPGGPFEPLDLDYLRVEANGLHVRAAIPGDAPAAFEFMSEVNEDFLPRPPSLEALEEGIGVSAEAAAEPADERTLNLVALVDGVVVGWIASHLAYRDQTGLSFAPSPLLERSAEHSFVSAPKPDARGVIHRALLAVEPRLVQSQGITRVFAIVHPDNVEGLTAVQDMQPVEGGGYGMRVFQRDPYM